MNTAKDLIQQCENLPILPEVSLRVQQIVNDPEGVMLEGLFPWVQCTSLKLLDFFKGTVHNSSLQGRNILISSLWLSIRFDEFVSR